MELDNLPDDIAELKDIILYQRDLILAQNEEIAKLKHNLMMSQNEDLIISLKNPWMKK